LPGDDVNDGDVAWLLADAASECLAGVDRHAVFVDLGAGNPREAIARILNVVARERFPLPCQLIADVTRWLDTYVGAMDEAPIRALLGQVQQP
jgi:hypothetical protein